jgi:hypothetical protein
MLDKLHAGHVSRRHEVRTKLSRKTDRKTRDLLYAFLEDPKSFVLELAKWLGGVEKKISPGLLLCLFVYFCGAGDQTQVLRNATRALYH